MARAIKLVMAFTPFSCSDQLTKNKNKRDNHIQSNLRASSLDCSRPTSDRASQVAQASIKDTSSQKISS